MTIVLYPGQSVTDLVAAPNAACPGCGGTWRRWGNARWRVVRDSPRNWRFRPSRVRCRGCGATQVVLPADVLVRRRDAVAIVAKAWRASAGGAGSRRVARLIGVPMETVRGWLRRLRALAGSMYRRSSGDHRDRLGLALAHVEAAARQAGWQTDGDLWRFVSYRSQGRLLCNTSWP